MSASAELTHGLPEELVTGSGTRLFLAGSVATGSAVVPRLALIVGGVTHPVVGPWAGAGGWEFAASVPVAGDRGPTGVELEVRSEGEPAERISLGAVALRRQLAQAPVLGAQPTAGDSTVAICLATHEPDLELLRRQVASIEAQTHTDWLLLVSDDNSSAEVVAELERLSAKDGRIFLSHSEQRLGFYGNFERALTMVPKEVTYIALADQDDVWFEDKLETLLGSIGEAQLAYADMRIVDSEGRVVQPGFWGERKNNSTNLASLLLANTVTGAACLFRRSLLDTVLPFPRAPGGPFHDHWIAAVALAVGRIEFVPRALHDYVQHGDAALGHASAMRGYRARRLIEPTAPRRSAARIAEHGRRTYVTNAWRLAIFAQVLEMRLGSRLGQHKLRAVQRVASLGGPHEPLAWLAARTTRSLAGRTETAGIEMSLLTAAIWRRTVSAQRSTR